MPVVPWTVALLYAAGALTAHLGATHLEGGIASVFLTGFLLGRLFDEISATHHFSVSMRFAAAFVAGATWALVATHTGALTGPLGGQVGSAAALGAQALLLVALTGALAMIARATARAFSKSPATLRVIAAFALGMVTVTLLALAATARLTESPAIIQAGAALGTTGILLGALYATSAPEHSMWHASILAGAAVAGLGWWLGDRMHEYSFAYWIAAPVLAGFGVRRLTSLASPVLR